MKLLLKVKNGTPPQRKSALRQLTDKAREFGAGPLFNQILPLLVRAVVCFVLTGLQPMLKKRRSLLCVHARVYVCVCMAAGRSKRANLV